MNNGQLLAIQITLTGMLIILVIIVWELRQILDAVKP